MDFVAGIVQAVTYQKDDYYVFTLDMKESQPYCSKSVTVRGSPHGLKDLGYGVPIKVWGRWQRHARYGLQFEMEFWSAWAQDSSSALKFLRMCVPDFGYPMISALRKVVLVQDIDVFALLKDPNDHLDLSDDVIQKGLLSWRRALTVRDLARFMIRGGFHSFELQAVLKVWGEDAPSIVKKNPYRLMELGMFDFARVDKIALSFGFELDSPQRLEGAVLWALRLGAKDNGHLFLRRGSIPSMLDEISKKAAPLETKHDPSFAKTFDSLVKSNSAVLDAQAGLYIPRLFEYERTSARLLAQLVQGESLVKVDLDQFLTRYQDSNGIALSDSQQEAVSTLTRHRVLVLTGLPGTGKTTATRAIVRLFEESNLSFLLMAPTGIASKRLASVTGYPAQTIHRSLKFNGSDWGRDANDPIPVDAIVVDELSMVDQELLYRLLVALRKDTMVVFVGDDAQLPSVGPGNVLRELVSCRALPRVKLTQIFRQSDRGEIVINSHRINKGQAPILHDYKSDSEFRFISTSDPQKIVSLVTRMAVKLKSRDANFQVMAPMYRGVVGVDNLNEELREALNPDKGQKEWEHPHLKIRFRMGDRLMVVRNDYELGVYNGDVGKLVGIEKEKLLVRIYSDPSEECDSIVAISQQDAPYMLRLAYCVTIHKAQGQEFGTVIMPLVQNHGRMLQRNLLYTGVTRARKQVWIVGEASAIEKAVLNNLVVRRNTVFGSAIETELENL